MGKDPRLPYTKAPLSRPPSPKRFSRVHAVVITFVLGIFWLATTWDCRHSHEEGSAGERVPLEVHIMSKCPDARDCLKKLVVPTMANISDKIDFRLSFIGKTTDDDDGVQCKHGQTECLGNIIELCAAAEYPDPKQYLGFTMCLEMDYDKIPGQNFVEDCALEHGIEFERLNHCMSKDDGAYGMGLLRDSVTRSADIGVETSCTIRLDNKTRCIYDNGAWRDCPNGHDPEDLISDVKKLYNKTQG